MINIYIFEPIIIYIEDYLNSLLNKLNLNIIKYKYKYQLDSSNCTYNDINIFVQSIPEYISENIYKNIYLLNIEQLSRYEYLQYVINISKKYSIIDYSRENINILKKYNINNVKYLPYIYNINEIYNINKSLNICMIHPNTAYRKKVYNDLISKNIKLDIIYGFGKKRDNELFKYKILLNIRQKADGRLIDDNKNYYNIFEIMRCYRCLFNKMIIISDNKYNHNLIDYNKHILFSKLEDIPNLINDVISNYEYYYKLLDLENIDISLNNHLIFF